MNLLFRYLRNYKGTLTGALALATINQVFSLLDPQLFRMIIDNYASKASVLPKGVFIQGVLLLLLTSVAVVFVSRVAKNFQDYYVNVITQRVGTQLYAHSVSHSFSLPYSVFEDQRSGELLQKLQKARTDSQNLIASAINTVFLALVGIVFVVIYAFYVHWIVGLIYFLIIPGLGSTIFFISRRIKKVQLEIVVETANLAGSTTETLRNVELVKSLGLENQEITRLNQVNDKILELELKKIKLIRKLSFVQGTVTNAIRSALLLVMLLLIFERAITLGQFFSLFVYSFFIFAPLAEMGSVSSNYQQAKASLEQVEKILAVKPEEKPVFPMEVGPLQTIEFKNVGFTYQSAVRPSVENLNLTIKGGETVAFVGPSGSGKTTLIKLIVGLYKPTVGKLLFNNISSENIEFEKLRARIGLVSQETQLFSGTIRDNLLFVNPQATDQNCLSVLKAAAAMTIVERGNAPGSESSAGPRGQKANAAELLLPGRGLDTKIGEGGLKISGGERQRLAIARALLRNPDLVIFDEATSSLDSITEKAITKTIQDIEKANQNSITILVAHRLSTVAHAHRIYVLERGHVVESGSHEQLLKKNGLYAALWREQIAEEREEATAIQLNSSI